MPPLLLLLPLLLLQPANALPLPVPVLFPPLLLQAGDCPQEWALFPSDGPEVCLKAFNESVSANSAKKRCQEEGGKLFSSNAFDGSQLQGLIALKEVESGRSYWVAGNSSEEGSCWELVFEEGPQLPHSEHLEGANCEYKLKFICQMTPEQPTTTSPTEPTTSTESSSTQTSVSTSQGTSTSPNPAGTNSSSTSTPDGCEYVIHVFLEVQG